MSEGGEGVYTTGANAAEPDESESKRSFVCDSGSEILVEGCVWKEGRRRKACMYAQCVECGDDRLR